MLLSPGIHASMHAWPLRPHPSPPLPCLCCAAWRAAQSAVSRLDPRVHRCVAFAQVGHGPTLQAALRCGTGTLMDHGQRLIMEHAACQQAERMRTPEGWCMHVRATHLGKIPARHRCWGDFRAVTCRPALLQEVGAARSNASREAMAARLAKHTNALRDLHNELALGDQAARVTGET